MVEKKNLTVLWHVLLWLLYFLVNFYHDIFYEEWTAPVLFYVLSYFVLIVFTFYLFYFLVAPSFLKKGRYLLILPFYLLFIFLKFVLQELLFPWFFGYANNEQDWTVLQYLEENIFMAFLPAAAGTLLYLFEQRQKNEARALTLMNERNEAELSFLRSQINPHFLFNTMSFLHTKAFKVDPSLADSIIRLSDVLRYSLKSSQSKRVTISEEVRLVEDLLEIYKDRFGEHCYVQFEKEGHGYEQNFEPLMLLPFIENAFKHGVYNDANHPIKFHLKVENASLVFSVRNKTKHQKKDEVSGIGISNLRKRLEMMYPGNHELFIKDDGNQYFASMKIEM